MKARFPDLIGLSTWQSIQDHFSAILKVNLWTLDDEAGFLTVPSAYPKKSEEILKSSRQALAYFNGCLKRAWARRGFDWKEGYQCPDGFYNFLIPFETGDRVWAYLHAGPVIAGAAPTLRTAALAIEQLNVEPDRFVEVLRQMKVFSFYGVRSTLELLHDIGSGICQVRQHALQMHTLLDKKQLAAQSLDIYREKLLTALLDVSKGVTGAERASVMLLDGESRLYVHVSRGLDEHIAQTARRRIGEGLSGMVVEKGMPLLLTAGLRNAYRAHCNNPSIKHSMLIPLKSERSEQKSFGVLSLGTYRATADKFNTATMETIDKLAQLVHSTLYDLAA